MGIRRVHGSGNGMHCHRDDHDPWREIMRAREAADAKHGANSIEQVGPDEHGKWLAILVEEVGELAHEMTYDGNPAKIRAEAIDIAAVITAFIAAIDGQQR